MSKFMINRRSLLKGTAAVGAGLATPTIFSSKAWAAGYTNEPKGGTVTFGFNVPQTGAYADEGADELRAYELAVEHINGGGDGGMAREVLRHKSVEHVTMVEIDAGVVEFSKEYLPMLSQGAFDDPRLNLVIADGADFMRQTQDRFDVIIVDSTDPIGPGEVLFTDTFYGHAKRALTEHGILVTQNGVPFLQGEELTNTLRAFKALFADWGCYLATIPTYAGGPMAFGWGTDGPARDVTVEDLQARFAAAEIMTDYYTPAVHKGAFALPGYVERLLP